MEYLFETVGSNVLAMASLTRLVILKVAVSLDGRLFFWIIFSLLFMTS